MTSLQRNAQPSASPTHSQLPPRARLPLLLVASGLIVDRRRTMQKLTGRYGSAFVLKMPLFGPTVMLADPALAKQVLTACDDKLMHIQPNLSRELGSGSLFALEGSEHRNRRKLLTPMMRGKIMLSYAAIVEDETLRETATWPQGREFPALGAMMRITLNVMLRAALGMERAELAELRALIPPMITLGARLSTLPLPRRTFGRYSPWERLARMRGRFTAIVGMLVDQAQQDPNLDERNDILSVLVRSRYDDGSSMSRQQIIDELLTLLAAGHETTAVSSAWMFERISRHPAVLSALVDEADTDNNELRQATIQETLRSRTVIGLIRRRVAAPMVDLGPWRIPAGYSILINVDSIHSDAELFPDPNRFKPQRFAGNRVHTACIPFGGGSRRCLGSAFALTQLDVLLRTVLRNFTIEPTTAPDEPVYSRGVTSAPKRGARITVHRRSLSAVEEFLT